MTDDELETKADALAADWLATFGPESPEALRVLEQLTGSIEVMIVGMGVIGLDPAVIATIVATFCHKLGHRVVDLGPTG